MPSLWPEYAESGTTVLDGERAEIGGLVFGFVGGGLRTPMRTPYEIDDETYAAKIAALGEVDVLCSHIPPDVPDLCYDTVARRFERGRPRQVRLVVEPGRLRRPGAALRPRRSGAARLPGGGGDREPGCFPPAPPTRGFAALSGQQQDALKELYEQWAPAVPVRELPHLGRVPQGVGDPRGAEPRPGDGGGADGMDGMGGADGGGGGDAQRAPAGLAALAGAVGAPGARPDRPAPDPWTVEDRLADDGVLLWRLPLPGADRDGLGLVRRGDELIVTVGPFHRVLPLPSALRRCTVSGAGLRDGWLQVRFTPDPDLWPKRL
ncbi:hypothetical protein SANTM175S_06990 [Streptomyces antimycoticus]